MRDKVKLLILKMSVGALTAAVIGHIVKAEMAVLDEAEKKLDEKKKRKNDSALES
jgi:hypothetical protein